ncbi:LTA synthase family protein [Mesorhizobium sp. CA18]|uniref:LTA synthase family protein n=1 Tax=unclassified Mesorhizobium TaxID=325217 RepID=UPI001CCB0F52|nr:MULTISPECIES: LTA synthase family protein [unclassified Mesorhizobium]MBZ9733993.1 LTA synthase family protein [Mesorhizobium sp. CA9]MBZ9825266.1 LTA synthase family protein [Mesorhizobium sp. CA18]MBZ9832309.1 LTA synthase family protein [Mesorhizobium sp. CA2]MBZ9836541.1 LTA synthase family protein [Mesorhizobium sp. CA3]MBZ9878161.1 LTA synthase family protein [Mesorhizobium sp. Ca11]
MARIRKGAAKPAPQFLEDDPSTGYLPGRAWPTVRYGLSTLLASALLVFAIELIVRGDFFGTVDFFMQPFKPGWTTIIVFALVLLGLDAILGRSHQSLMIVAPLTLALAFVGHQKSRYLGDPLYPTDFLFARQIMALMPLLVRERPWTAVMLAVGIVGGLTLLVYGWRTWRRRVPILSRKGRMARLALAVPLLAFFVSIMDYATFSWTRDRLQIIPIMWDQKENYASNGFALAFAMNVPMAHVAAPPGYSEKTMAAIQRPDAAASMPDEKPDIVVVMSESFWDPTHLPGVTIKPDPIPTVRALRSGSMFSPEFGGMTANIEFEALTGFSNAFLPAGSIPYQQYVRTPTPSLATFLKSQGYRARAIHPGTNWFWNRGAVYADFGFNDFRSEETLPPMEKRGPLASDAAMTDEIIREADTSDDPVFLFAVSLQNHGPYEPYRYYNPTHSIDAPISSWARESLLSYAEGSADADRGLQRLIDWAKARQRPTIIAFFGDHLPPLGPVYVETGFLKDNVAPRKEPAVAALEHHDTPLVIWSNRSGPVENIGSVSPAFLPYHILTTAGISHPYYTGFLGALREHYRVVDRNLLLSPVGEATPDWARQKQIDPKINDFRLIQYDMMFGKRLSAPDFFPETVNRLVAHTS